MNVHRSNKWKRNKKNHFSFWCREILFRAPRPEQYFERVERFVYLVCDCVHKSFDCFYFGTCSAVLGAVSSFSSFSSFRFIFRTSFSCVSLQSVDIYNNFFFSSLLLLTLYLDVVVELQFFGLTIIHVLSFQYRIYCSMFSLVWFGSVAPLFVLAKNVYNVYDICFSNFILNLNRLKWIFCSACPFFCVSPFSGTKIKRWY